jgi:phosphoribosylamine--glycine ligase
MNILIIGSGAREHAIARAFQRSATAPTLFCCATSNNPGIQSLAKGYWVGNICDSDLIVKQAKEWQIDFAIIGPEAPLEQGVADALWQNAIPTIGPKKYLAQLETSKAFTRDLLKKYGIKGSPEYKVFHDLSGVKEFLAYLGEKGYVIKADGLMGGKGVKVAGDHLHSLEEAYQFCQTLYAEQRSFVIEEKCIGEEFSFMCFCDGTRLIPMPLVQDHKRAFIQDTGPNTGGMGSYSDSNHRLPFLTETDVQAAFAINQAVIKALAQETDEKYIGILYGSFMATKTGVRLIEFNARFGDPEVMNVLALLESDFVAICQAMLTGKLTQDLVRFNHQATVCKYAVPNGYPDHSIKNELIDISEIKNHEQLYLAGVDVREGLLYATGSRTAAVIGIAATITLAEKIAEQEIVCVKGPLFHRIDIGTEELVNRRIQMMQALRAPSLGILGSTRGTDLQAIIDAIEQKRLAAHLKVVVSNKENAYILERARKHELPAIFLDPTQAEFETKLSEIFRRSAVDFIILIGYMRILSADFVKEWQHKIINVHPSLLPAFAGGMNQHVHQSVLESGEKKTGCTVHIVTEEVDAGPILVQKECDVLPGDTVETLKQRVQILEGDALIEAIQLLVDKARNDRAI